MKIKNILKFHNVADLIENCKPEIIKALNKDFIYILASLNDFESLDFMLINDCQVLTVDGITGEVYDEMPVDDFIRRAFDCAIDQLAINRF